MSADIKSFTYENLKDELLELSLPSYRAGQIFAWLHKYGCDNFDSMSNIAKPLRAALAEKYFISSCVAEEKYVSSLDGTVKYLFRLYDGEYIESVVMKYKYGYTICVFTQVGCKMGCSFLRLDSCRV